MSERMRSTCIPGQTDAQRQKRIAERRRVAQQKAKEDSLVKAKEIEVRSLLEGVHLGEEVGIVDPELTQKIKSALSKGGVDLVPDSKLTVVPMTGGGVIGFHLYEVEDVDSLKMHPESNARKIIIDHTPSGYIRRALSGACSKPNRLDAQRFIVICQSGKSTVIDAERVMPSVMDRLDLTAGLARAVLPQKAKI